MRGTHTGGFSVLISLILLLVALGILTPAQALALLGTTTTGFFGGW